MGCQKNIAARIISKNSDYIQAIKDNQPTLRLDALLMSKNCRPNDDYIDTDASQKRGGNSAENFSRLLRFARNILKRYKDTHPTRLSYRSMKFKAALQEDFALEVLKAVFA